MFDYSLKMPKLAYETDGLDKSRQLQVVSICPANGS